jgi:hypothetical protein
VDVRFKDDKAFLDYSSLCKVGEEIITLLIKKLVLRNQTKLEYHYKKTEAII